MSAPRRRDKPRVWTANALAKVRALYEAGDLSLPEIGARFRVSYYTIQRLARRHKWVRAATVSWDVARRTTKASPVKRAPGDRLTRKALGAVLKRFREEQRAEALDTLEERMRTFRCRRLVGKEFAARAAELMERDRAERARNAHMV